jgi:hypothetical protein
MWLWPIDGRAEALKGTLLSVKVKALNLKPDESSDPLSSPACGPCALWTVVPCGKSEKRTELRDEEGEAREGAESRSRPSTKHREHRAPSSCLAVQSYPPSPISHPCTGVYFYGIPLYPAVSRFIPHTPLYPAVSCCIPLYPAVSCHTPHTPPYHPTSRDRI